MSNEQAESWKANLREEAWRMYREESTVRDIINTLGVDTMEAVEAQEEAPDRYAAIREGIALAIAVVASQRPDVNFLMQERDRYRDQILSLSRSSPGIPIHPTAPGPNLDRGILGEG